MRNARVGLDMELDLFQRLVYLSERSGVRLGDVVILCLEEGLASLGLKNFPLIEKGIEEGEGGERVVEGA